MKKGIKYLAILFLLILTTPLAAWAAGPKTIQTGRLSPNIAYNGYKYLLDSYDVNINVNENNTFNITENIGVYFNIPQHGIYRKIPLKNEVKRLDGTKSANRAKITSLAVSEAYTLSAESGYKVVKIGDANTMLTGAKNYTIRYTYDIGRDPGKNYDEFYFNIVGPEWENTAIGNITFTITMPKEFDASKLGFSSGPVGSADSSGIEYQVDGNVITGSYNGVLSSGEALTVRLELPEGYFTYNNTMDMMTYLSFALPVLFMLITVLLWFMYGRDERTVETVEFYPPEGFNSAEVGFLYKGKADNNDVISLLIYLANKGYIKISEFEEHSLFKKSQAFKLTKLKEYDGNNENERLFLTGLFNTPKRPSIADLKGLLNSNYSLQPGDTSSGRNEVTSADLTNSFYVTLNSIVKNLNNKENRQTIFEKTSLGKGSIVVLLIAIVYALITIRPVTEYSGTSNLIFALLFPGIGFTVLFYLLFGKTKLPVKIFGLVWGLGFGGMPWATIVLPALRADPTYLAAYGVGIVCVLIMIIMFKIMPKRTAYGNELLGKIKGFKNFLELAEKPKLEELVLQDPVYFYNILPFTYVLGVSDTWIKKFEVIALQAPDWYAGNTAFNMVAFGSFMNATMASATTAMSSSPSSGGSGGGSSGGGSGGGGGGSW